jgi:hypothetical protein
MSIAYTRPYLYPKQQKAIFSGKRWSCCEASTKSGKTQGAIIRLIEWGLFGNGNLDADGKPIPAGPGQIYWWVAPVSAQANIAFERIKTNLTHGTFTSRASPVPTITLLTGAKIEFKSGDNPDSLYGEDVYAAIGDEASRWLPGAWPALRSTLTATRGPAVLIGNVKGRANFFYEMCRRIERGEEPNGAFMRITWRDAVEAGVLDFEEIEDAKRNLPELIFRELYEAVASDDTGNPFGQDHIRACIGPLSKRKPVAFGVDLAKHQDYTVVIGLDDNGAVCVFERWQGLPWPMTIGKIRDLIDEDARTLVDSTGLGDPVLDELKVEHGNFVGFHFTQAAKQRLMEGLAVSIQAHELTFPNGHIVNELLLFEYEVNKNTHNVRYNAPSGYHDDCVAALALARQAWVESAPAQNLMDYYAAQAAKGASISTKAAGELDPEPVYEPGPLFNELVENELLQLYEDKLGEYADQPIVCLYCHKPIGANKISDGVFVWHRECFGAKKVA